MTTSFYYVDPDGNSVELQADNFGGDWERSSAFWSSRSLAANPIGMNIDPSRSWRRGTPAQVPRRSTAARTPANSSRPRRWTCACPSYMVVQNAVAQDETLCRLTGERNAEPMDRSASTNAEPSGRRCPGPGRRDPLSAAGADRAEALGDEGPRPGPAGVGDAAGLRRRQLRRQAAQGIPRRRPRPPCRKEHQDALNLWPEIRKKRVGRLEARATARPVPGRDRHRRGGQRPGRCGSSRSSRRS